MKLDQGSLTVGIIGLGYVGLPLALNFSKVSSSVIGFEANHKYISMINSGKSYISHISHQDIKTAIKSGLQATNDYKKIAECDFIVLCLPTPLNNHREPDLSFVISAMNEILPYIRRGQAISLESTTYPGTTDEIIAPMIETRKFVIG